jgi:hypothetical protein
MFAIYYLDKEAKTVRRDSYRFYGWTAAKRINELTKLGLIAWKEAV